MKRKNNALSETAKIIVLSDLHISPGEESRPENPLARLHAAVDDIAANHADAAAVVVMGDIAHRGDAASYRLAADALSRLPVPVYPMPGNHDNRANMRRVFPALPDGFMQQVFSTPAGDFILADTVREGEVAGEYCARRAEWLRETLRQTRRPAFVCMHHPPLLLPLLQDVDFTPEYFRPLEDIIAAAPGMIRYFLFGHVHAAAGGVWRGIPFTALRSFGPQTYLSDETPAGGKNYIFTNAQPHYGILLADESQVVFHHHGFLENIPVR